MDSLFTVTGVLHNQNSARAFRAVVAKSGIALKRIRVASKSADPEIQSRRARRDSTGGAGDSARNGAYLISVEVRSLRDRMRIEALLAAAGAR